MRILGQRDSISIADYDLQRPSLTDQGADLGPENDVPDIVGIVDVKNHDWNPIVHAQAEGGRVHYPKAFGQGFGVGNSVVTFRFRVELRVTVVDTVDFGRLENNVGTDFTGA